MPVLFAAATYPGTQPVFERYGIPWRDRRVPAWLGLVQPVAQRGLWYADGFVAELRAALPQADPLQALSDLDLVHCKIREVAAAYPAAARLFAQYDIPCADSPVPPWEPIEQAAARHGVWPVAELLAELNRAVQQEAGS
jgi:hypothetical protein